ncbi:hypothetical protein [Deefgea piscis]|uniref:hypothetical protein n=1 Tax=Deefgea piscis TaxID=2739061 RepID=UPI001C7E9A15|nr:hypothetical protein [Deefgea piscis]QZA79648.1 hypothetical protein K4H25_08710 [Deefgea piscis]
MKLREIISLLALSLMLAACGGAGDSNGEMGGGGGSGSGTGSGTGGGSTGGGNGGTGGGGSGTEERNPVVDRSIKLLDQAQQLNASSFGLDDAAFLPSAVVLKDNILYIANDLISTPAAVLRFDLNANKALTPISNFSSNGSTDDFKRLYDINQFQDRLYTASLSSNRVDIFDISQSEPRFITALGTGNWSGPSNQVLVHPIAVAANANYIFAADTDKRISVWKQSDATPANNKKAIKHAYLSLPDCTSTYCDVKLATVGERLFASFGNGKTLVYDVGQLAESTTMVQPIMQQNSVSNTLIQGDDGQLYVSRTGGGIDRFASSNLPASGAQILPATPLDQFRQINLADQAAPQNLLKAKDIGFNQQTIAAIQNKDILILPQRQVDELHHIDKVTTQQYQYAAMAAAQKGLLLQDSDSWETLTNPQLRSFAINKILSGKLDQRQLALSSYSAIPVRNLEIQARLKGSEPWFVLGSLDQLPAFSTVRFDVAINDGRTFQRVDDKGSVQFKGLDALSVLPSDLFEIRIDSKTDAHVQKISNFKMKWQLSFGKYDADGSDGSWGKINPIYAREWVIMMTNFAYVLNSPEFEHVWFNHKKVMGHDFFGNAGQVDAPSGFFTGEDYRNNYQAIMNRGGIRLGVTTMGGGLGGGDVLGIDTWNFYEHYFRNAGVIGHEFGHHWGSHNSAWSNSSYGLQSSSAQLLEYFLRKQQLPYMDPNTNGFHLAPREMLYNGIVEGMRVPRKDTEVNNLERYFSANPL